MTQRGRVTPCCLNFHALIFQGSILIEVLDRIIMTFSRHVSHFRFGSCCGSGTSTSSISDGRALRLAVDPDLAPTVKAWDLGLVFDPVPWV